MFARSNLGSSGGPGPNPASPERRERLIGAIVLITLIVLLLLAILGADATIFNPLNDSDAATQTYDAAHGRGTLPPGHPPILPVTPDNSNPNQHVVFADLGAAQAPTSGGQ